MSVVAARIYSNRIVMAADSIVVKYGEYKDTTQDFIKMHKANGVLVGVSGKVSEASLLFHYLETHKPATGTEKAILEYLIEFVRWKKELTGDATVSNQCLLAFEGKLFQVYGITVLPVRDFASVGHGLFYANAAMHLGHTPREAVKVACDLDCFVSEPILEEIMEIE